MSKKKDPRPKIQERPCADCTTEQLITLVENCIHREQKKNKLWLFGEAVHAQAVEEMIHRIKELDDELDATRERVNEMGTEIAKLKGS